MAHRDRLLLRAIARHASHLASGQHVDLPGLAATMRQRLAAGEGLGALLPEAFNAMCEAYRRTRGPGRCSSSRVWRFIGARWRS
ncbi:hypothetical protein [Micromonospora sp. SL4-19]|uniref:hypothetical protein n=1 Tax=Micromonospora sp. SL4-19 TaxID=3399129 RepID=UPI003A4D9ECA